MSKQNPTEREMLADKHAAIARERRLNYQDYLRDYNRMWAKVNAERRRRREAIDPHCSHERMQAFLRDGADYDPDMR